MQKIIRMLVEHCTPLKYKGNKANTSALPADADIGDIYNIGSSIEGDDYYWNGQEWEKLTSTLDLSPFLKKTEASSTYAPKASPTFTGTPKAPTASSGTNTTQIATTAFVQTELGSFAPLASPALTDTPTAPTAAVGTDTTQIATTAFVQAAIAKLITDYGLTVPTQNG